MLCRMDGRVRGDICNAPWTVDSEQRKNRELDAEHTRRRVGGPVIIDKGRMQRIRARKYRSSHRPFMQTSGFVRLLARKIGGEQTFKPAPEHGSGREEANRNR